MASKAWQRRHVAATAQTNVEIKATWSSWRHPVATCMAQIAKIEGKARKEDDRILDSVTARNERVLQCAERLGIVDDERLGTRAMASALAAAASGDAVGRLNGRLPCADVAQMMASVSIATHERGKSQRLGKEKSHALVVEGKEALRMVGMRCGKSCADIVAAVASAGGSRGDSAKAISAVLYSGTPQCWLRGFVSLAALTVRADALFILANARPIATALNAWCSDVLAKVRSMGTRSMGGLVLWWLVAYAIE